MHTDKPITLSVRDYIIRRLSPRLRISEETISSVISHQYSTGNAATKIHNEVEFSGLGKFLFSPKKAQYKLDRYKAIRSLVEGFIAEGKRLEHYQKKLDSLNNDINYIETKFNV